MNFRKTLPILLLATVICLFAEPSAAETNGRRLAALRDYLSDINSLTGSFIQEKHIPHIKDPVISKGRFRFQRPDYLWWEYLEPAPSALELSKGRVRAWNGPKDDREEQSAAMAEAAKTVAEQVMLWMNMDPDSILAAYEVSFQEAAPIVLKVVPKQRSARKYIKSLVVEFADDSRTVRRVTIKEAEGEIIIRFKARAAGQDSRK